MTDAAVTWTRLERYLVRTGWTLLRDDGHRASWENASLNLGVPTMVGHPTLLEVIDQIAGVEMRDVAEVLAEVAAGPDILRIRVPVHYPAERCGCGDKIKDDGMWRVSRGDLVEYFHDGCEDLAN